MSASINLKELERRGYRRTYEDGLLEIEIGGILASFAVFAFNIFPGEAFESTTALGLYLAGITMSSLVYWLGKRWVTLPRIGMVNFGPQRQKSKRNLVVALSVIVGIQVAAILLQVALLASPELSMRLTPYLGDHFGSTLVVAILGVVFVAPGLLLIAYFLELPHGYLHTVMIALAIFLMILLDQAGWMAAVGIFIMVEGIVHLVQFMRKYPLPPRDATDAER